VKERIAAFVREQAYRPLTAAELADALNVTPSGLERFERILAELEKEGQIILTRAGRYGAPERMNLVVGRVQGHPRGFGFLIPDPTGTGAKATDIFLGKESLNGAMHGDRVVVRPTAVARDGRPEGEVIRILTRAHQRVVGNFDQTKFGGFVTPDDKRIPEDILVPKGFTAGARPGEKVVLLITRYPDGRKPAEGRVVERLGRADDPDVEVQGIIRKHNLPEQFPQKVQREADAIPLEITPEELQGRRDLRRELIVTIDGADAKDLDDAIQVKRLPNGNFELGVHIADVSHYVKENSALDREAYQRATSVYFADRVIPMLPPRLSNGICSLHPHEDRLTLSCTMEIDRAGKVVRFDIYPSVIRSAERLTYTEVSALLEGEAVTDKLKPLAPMLRDAGELAEILRQKRLNRGALDFDLPEAKLIMGDEGVPAEIHRAERRVANRLIEEFMLAANECVAEYVARMELPFVYRIHEEPAEDRLGGLAEFLALFGYRLRVPKGKVHPKTLQEITLWAEGRKEESLINTVLLRSMKQAKYAPTNEGHFGLAAEYYCHFTSPIRRYPDLIVHRVLKEILAGRMSAKRRQRLEIVTAEAALQSSERERAAVEAEREVEDLLKCRFMQAKVGEEFEGIISSVTPFGFFVQLPNTVEGLVHISTLTDDYYHYEERTYALVGERSKRRYRLGDAVRVQLVRADTAARQIDFALLGSLEEEAAPRGQTARVSIKSVRDDKSTGPRRGGDSRSAAENRPQTGLRPVRGGRRSDEAVAPPTVEPVVAPPVAAEERADNQAPPRERQGHSRRRKSSRDETRRGNDRRTETLRDETRRDNDRRTETLRDETRRGRGEPDAPAPARDMWGVPLPSRAIRSTNPEIRREETGTSQAPYSLPAQADRNSRRSRSKKDDGAPLEAAGATSPEARTARPAANRREARPAGAEGRRQGQRRPQRGRRTGGRRSGAEVGTPSGNGEQ
jgi:ribonuclease R